MVGMDPLHVCIALAPLAAYLVLLGAIHLRARPLLTTGGRDLAALAVAVSGLIAAGPMELFLSEGAAALYGGWVWMIMLTAYGLSVLLIATHDAAAFGDLQHHAGAAASALRGADSSP